MMNQSIFVQILLASSAWAILLAPPALAQDQQTSLTVSLGFAVFPLENTCEGADISPEIGISGCNSSFLAIIMEDPDAPSGTFTHWTVWNIPANTSLIRAAVPRNSTIEQPFFARQGQNDFGEIGYAGPCPPPGKPHRYLFKVFGLDGMLDLPGGSSVSDLREAMTGHVLQEGTGVATFRR
ncbi:MAG: YbhB/YbcL family Raf kinase inhibitor-like protein [Methanothrix sp.]|nr:YbhB/YbcL family Raf kinase inhibitor-like protein [Methanothrix sp.]